MNNKLNIVNSISWLFGIAVLFAGVVNIFWGNDSLFGVFIFSLSFIFFPPLNLIIKKRTGYAIPGIVKILLAIFIVWATLGVGELLSKIKLMLSDL